MQRNLHKIARPPAPRGAAMVGFAISSILCSAALFRPDDNGTFPILIAHSDDRLPSATAQDWVTYADAVVVASPVAEQEIPPSPVDLERGEGLILRDVTMRINQVLWTSPIADRAVPSTIHWTAHGWMFTEGDTKNRVVMTGEGQPRLETGHTYVIALDWQQESCAPGDIVPGRWRGLGAGAVVPFDDGVLGHGEFEAAVRSAIPSGDTASLRDQLAGRDETSIMAALKAAQLTVRQRFSVPSGTCPDVR